MELINGETYNGKLMSCDSYMNIVMEDVILTTRVCFMEIDYSSLEWIPILSNGGVLYSRLYD